MKKSTANISTLVAVGGSLVALPAAAIELGDVQVRSHLGQPLRASIAYALAPNEAISGTCVSVHSGHLPGGVPGIGEATVSVANGIISISGKTAIREPLVTMRLDIRCPYAAQISRDYTMLVDPAFIEERTVASPAPAVRSNVAAAANTAAPAVAPRPATGNEPVREGTRYQVQPGETLSEIAQRIVDRPVALWPAVNGIFAANPDAFLDSDPNKLKAGSWLTIPDFGAAAPLSIAPSAPLAAESAAESAPPQQADLAKSSLYTGATAEQTAVPVAREQAAPLELQVPEPSQLPAAEVIDIPDTGIAVPPPQAASPNVPTARVQRTAAADAGSNWMLWLAGAGIAIIALLLLFGRLVRSRFGSSPIGEAVPRERRQPDSSRTLEVVSEMEVSIGELDETQENLALDADLIIGSGLQNADEVDIAQDFGFAATTHLDHELTEDMVSDSEESEAETDIIPPLNIEAQSILESEVLPDAAGENSDEDDYDMSVIVDATKMPDPEEVTLKDLEAVQVETGDDTLLTDDYTVSSEVDYTVLEQDYEDELSATQALNEEIARAAAELADDLDVSDSDTSHASTISALDVSALDVTAQLPANDDDDASDDDDVTARFRAERGA